MGFEGSLTGATPSPAVLVGEMLPDPLDEPARPHPALLLHSRTPAQAVCAVPGDEEEEWGWAEGAG